MLLASEEDLRGFQNEPMAFPIFGQGRVLYALVGKGIKVETVDRAAQFLIGSCSCQVKEQNPGVDLVMATDWKATPLKLLWKKPVGEGWSSFAVAGEYAFTQEQRGPKETVVCYDAETGKEIWSRGFDARFEEALGGPGPRATPTVGAGGLFVVGATGIFARLNPSTGEVVWQIDLATEAQRQVLANQLKANNQQQRTETQEAAMRAAQSTGQGQAQKVQPMTREKTPGRNEPCFCGSGKKYKNCHGA